MIKTRYWVIAIVLILVLSGVSAVAILAHRTDGVTASIILDGAVVRTVELDAAAEPYEFDVTSEYGTNRIRVEDGRICVVDADCPDRLCVRMGWRKSASLPIACLPHRLVIEITDGGEDGVDAVAGVKP